MAEARAQSWTLICHSLNDSAQAINEIKQFLLSQGFTPTQINTVETGTDPRTSQLPEVLGLLNAHEIAQPNVAILNTTGRLAAKSLLELQQKFQTGFGSSSNEQPPVSHETESTSWFTGGVISTLGSLIFGAHSLEALKKISSAGCVEYEVIITNYRSKVRTLKFHENTKTFIRVRGENDIEPILFKNIIKCIKISPTQFQLLYQNSNLASDWIETKQEFCEEIFGIFKTHDIVFEEK